MGKSKIAKMRPNHLTVNIGNRVETKNWNHGGHEEQQQNNSRIYTLPAGMDYYTDQVGGHMTDGIHLGLMRSKGKIYKPVSSRVCGEREINFYETLQTTQDPILKELKNLVPKYHGTETYTIDGNEVKYIVLDDVTKEIKEPCIMDIKIGRVTYDPLATLEKIKNENSKYFEMKRDLGIAIPGFQVFKISNGRICKFGKDYGKKLNKETAIDAFRIFLNAGSGLNRSLLMQILTSLWRIQNWARKQRQLRLISSSLLIVYDARKLRQSISLNPNSANASNSNSTATSPSSSPRPRLHRANSLSRPISMIMDKLENLKTGFSGQLTKDGPILESPSSPTRIKQFSPVVEKKGAPSLKRMHSFQNNYDKDLQSMKHDYNTILDGLVSEKKHYFWATVKIIDFAHVFPSENGGPDNNFLEGLENLVKVFEEFLLETDVNFFKDS